MVASPNALEIKTGRRLIEFFLSPLLKYGQESIRERERLTTRPRILNVLLAKFLLRDYTAI